MTGTIQKTGWCLSPLSLLLLYFSICSAFGVFGTGDADFYGFVIVINVLSQWLDFSFADHTFVVEKIKKTHVFSSKNLTYLCFSILLFCKLGLQPNSFAEINAELGRLASTNKPTMKYKVFRKFTYSLRVPQKRHIIIIK